MSAMACRCAKPVFLRNRIRLGATVASTSTSGRTAAEQHAGRARRNARSCSAAANGNSQTPHDLPALILKKNAENAIMVYSKSWCPFCHEAKRVLSTAVEAAKGDAARLTVVELDALADGDDVQDALMSITGVRTVPQVFIGGHFVGGCDDTIAIERSGELDKIIRSALAASPAQA